jgi:type I restriction enzyme S subunit
MTAHLAQLGDVLASAESGFASGEDVTNGLAQVRMNNVTRDGELDWSSIRRVPTDSQTASRFLLCPGDILFNNTNSPELVGKSALFNGFKEPLVYSNHFLRLRVHRGEVDPAFISYWLHYSWRRNSLQRLATRWVNQAAIRKDDLFQLKLVVPSIEKQKKVVAQLNEAAILRRMRRYAIRMCGELAPAVFIEMFGDPRNNAHGYRRAELGSLLSRTPSLGTTTPCSQNGKFLCVRVGEIGAEEIDYLSCGRVNLSPTELIRYSLLNGDILLARAIGSAEHLGKLSVVARTLSTGPVVHDSHVMRIRTNSAVLLPDYLASLLRTSAGRALFMRQARRTAVQFNVNSEQIEGLTFPLPPIEEQKRFAAFLFALQKLRGVQNEALRQADHLFQTLLYQAFNPN